MEVMTISNKIEGGKKRGLGFTFFHAYCRIETLRCHFKGGKVRILILGFKFPC